MTTVISGKTATSDLTINAPTASAQFSEYFIGLIDSNDLENTPQVLSISRSTTATGFNLTSFGRTDSTDGFNGTVWRLRNGTPVDVSGTLTGYGFGLVNTYDDLPAETDTFVISPFASGSATHIFTVGGTRKIKAASNNLFRDKDDDIIGGDSYEIIGGSGDDTLTGADLRDILRGRGGRDILQGGDGNDLLFGGGGRDDLQGGEGNDLLSGQDGNDTLTGGPGRDRFRLTNQGIERFTDFNLDDGDIFQIRVDRYPTAPAAGTTPVVGDINNVSANIYVDELSDIVGVTMSSVNFAYATDTDQLLYDADGDWSNGRIVVARTNDFGSPATANFQFIEIN